MALLLDGSPSTIEDLCARDSDLQLVAAAEGLDLTTKLKLATDDLMMTIGSMLPAAGAPSDSMLSPGLRNIAVTPLLKYWHTYASLRLVYQDLYFSRLNDRYKAKMTLYLEEEARALEAVRAQGVGIVLDPLPQASSPEVGTVSSTDAGGTMYVGVTLSNRYGEEGLISLPIQVDTQDGHAALIKITLSGNNVTGWNLYAGTAPNTLVRQNSTPLAPYGSQALAPLSLKGGPESGLGQQPNQFLPLPRRLLRG